MSGENLKQRIVNKESINIALAWFSMSEEEISDVLKKNAYDMVFLDGQHSALNEEQIPVFCQKAEKEGVPVLFRIKHTKLAFLTGNYLDLGPMGIVIPQVESVETVREAIDNFYYPPIGKRGWGPSHAYGKQNIQGRREYADWWNKNGILAIQLESLNAVKKARDFVLPGVDMIMYGPMDLTFSIEEQSDKNFTSLDDCYNKVEKDLFDMPVKLTRRGNPFGMDL